MPRSHKYCFVKYRGGVNTVAIDDSLLARFWSKVDRRGDHECWPWTGAKTRVGYGQLSVAPRGSSPLSTHRLAWVLTHGAITDGQHVLHRCDNRPCCNPAHLFLGTHTDNMRDAAEKGRLHVARPRSGKLTPEQLAVVDELLASGVAQIVISRRFDVSRGWVSLYAKGKRRQYDRPSGSLRRAG